MKKLFVAVALVMGLGTSVAFADNFMVDSVTITMINDFTPIEVKDLPAAVQELSQRTMQNLLSKKLP